MDNLQQVPKILHFVWLGKLGGIQQDYIKLWGSINGGQQGYKIKVWYDPQALLVHELGRQIKQFAVKSTFIGEDDYVDKVFQLQNQAHQAIKQGLAQGKTFDQAASEFISTVLHEEVERVAISQKLEKIRVDNQASFSRFLTEAGEDYQLADINTLLTSEKIDRKYYYQELALRQNLAAASDIVRLQALDQQGGIYFDADFLPALKSGLWEGISSSLFQSRKYDLKFIEIQLVLEHLQAHLPERQALVNEKKYPDYAKKFASQSQEQAQLVEAMRARLQQMSSTSPRDFFQPLGRQSVERNGVRLAALDIGKGVSNAGIIADVDSPALAEALRQITYNYQRLEKVGLVNIQSISEIRAQENRKSPAYVTYVLDSKRDAGWDVEVDVFQALGYRKDGLVAGSRATMVITGPPAVARALQGLQDDPFSELIGEKHVFTDFTFNTEEGRTHSWDTEQGGTLRSQFRPVMSQADLLKQAYVLGKPIGSSYQGILTSLDKIHHSQGVERIETAFVLKNQIQAYLDTYPASGRNTAFRLLASQLDAAMILNIDADEEKEIIQQAKSQPTAAAERYRSLFNLSVLEHDDGLDTPAQESKSSKLESWEKPKVKINPEGGDTQYDGQIIIQLENDKTVRGAAARLAGKHPNTVLVQLDAKGNYRVIYGNPGEIRKKSNLRWQLVGHGRGNSTYPGYQRKMAHQTPIALAHNLANFNQAFRKEYKNISAPSYISLVGCTLVDCDQKKGFAKTFATELNKEGIRADIAARSTTVGVSKGSNALSSGHKLSKDLKSGKWLHKAAEYKLILRWNQQGQLVPADNLALRQEKAVAIVDEVATGKKLSSLDDIEQADLKQAFHTADNQLDKERILWVAHDPEQRQQWKQSLQQALITDTQDQLTPLSVQEILQQHQRLHKNQQRGIVTLYELGMKNHSTQVAVEMNTAPQGLFIPIALEGEGYPRQATKLGLLWLHAQQQGGSVDFFDGLERHLAINSQKAIGGTLTDEMTQASRFQQQFNLFDVNSNNRKIFTRLTSEMTRSLFASGATPPTGSYLLQGEHHAIMLDIRQDTSGHYTHSFYDAHVGVISFSGTDLAANHHAMHSALRDYLQAENSSGQTRAQQYGISTGGSDYQFQAFKINLLETGETSLALNQLQSSLQTFVSEEQRIRRVANITLEKTRLNPFILSDMGAMVERQGSLSQHLNDDDLLTKLRFNPKKLMQFLDRLNSRQPFAKTAVRVLKKVISQHPKRTHNILTAIQKSKKNVEYYMALKTLKLIKETRTSEFLGLLRNGVVTPLKHWKGYFLTAAKNVPTGAMQALGYAKALLDIQSMNDLLLSTNLTDQQRKVLIADRNFALFSLHYSWSSDLAQMGLGKWQNALNLQAKQGLTSRYFKFKLGAVTYAGAVLGVVGAMLDFYSAYDAIEKLSTTTDPDDRQDLMVSAALSATSGMINLAVTAALLLGASSVFGFVGFAVGIALFAAGMIYSGVRAVQRIEKVIELSAGERSETFFRSLVNRPPHAAIQDSMAEKLQRPLFRKNYDQHLFLEAKQYLRDNLHIDTYYYSRGDFKLQNHHYLDLYAKMKLKPQEIMKSFPPYSEQLAASNIFPNDIEEVITSLKPKIIKGSPISVVKSESYYYKPSPLKGVDDDIDIDQQGDFYTDFYESFFIPISDFEINIRANQIAKEQKYDNVEAQASALALIQDKENDYIELNKQLDIHAKKEGYQDTMGMVMGMLYEKARAQGYQNIDDMVATKVIDAHQDPYTNSKALLEKLKEKYFDKIKKHQLIELRALILNQIIEAETHSLAQKKGDISPQNKAKLKAEVLTKFREEGRQLLEKAALEQLHKEARADLYIYRSERSLSENGLSGSVRVVSAVPSAERQPGVMIALGEGNDKAKGAQNKKNYFRVGKGRKTYTGGRLSDTFYLTDATINRDVSELKGGSASRLDNQDILVANDQPPIGRGYYVNLTTGELRYRRENGELSDLVARLTHIEHVIGHADTDDILIGDNNNNLLSGEGGEDQLRGFAGNDHLKLAEGKAYGGDGEDLYSVLQNPWSTDSTLIINDSYDRQKNTAKEDSLVLLAYDVAQVKSIELIPHPSQARLYQIKIVLHNDNDSETTLLLEDAYQRSADEETFELINGYSLQTRDGLFLPATEWPESLEQQELPPLQMQYITTLDEKNQDFLKRTPQAVIRLKQGDTPDSNTVTVNNRKSVLPDFMRLSLTDTPFNDYLEGNEESNTFVSARNNDRLQGKANRDFYHIYHQPSVNGEKASREIIIDNQDSDPSPELDLLILHSVSIDKMNKITQQGDDIVLSANGTDPDVAAISIRLINFLRSDAYRHIVLVDKEGDAYFLDVENHNAYFYRALIDEQENISRGQKQGDTRATQGDDIIRLSGALFLSDNTFDALAGNDRILDQSHADRTLRGGLGDDILLASNRKGIKTLYGDEGRDELYGGFDNDKLYGGADDDILKGNEGDDLLDGGSGNDTYLYRFGDGHDVIVDSEGNNRLKLLGDITLATIRTRAVKYKSLQIIFARLDSNGDDDESQAITIKGYYNVTDVIYSIELNGVSYTIEELVTASTIQFQGTSGSYVRTGGVGDDQLGGHSGNDYLYGKEGRDWITGEGGNDTLHGGSGDDRLEGGLDDDSLYGDNGNDALYGESGDDKLYGGTGDDELYGGVGDDLLYGGAGDDQLNGGTGKDELHGGDGKDQLYGAEGEDKLYGGTGDDQLYGGAGDDELCGNSGKDRLYGDKGNDRLEGGKGNDQLAGGEGDDTYYYQRGDGQDVIHDSEGNSSLQFLSSIGLKHLELQNEGHDLKIKIKSSTDADDDDEGAVTLADYFSSRANRNVMIRIKNIDYTLSSLLDTLARSRQAEPSSPSLPKVLVRHKWRYGNDDGNHFRGSSGNDYLFGNGGNDRLEGGLGNDWLFGGEGNDVLQGNTGNNLLYGGAGDDQLFAGEGCNYFEGGVGNDELIDQGGDSIYYYARGDGSDIITDQGGMDILELGDGIVESDVSLSREGNNLYITIATESAEDKNSIRVNNHFLFGYQLEKLKIGEKCYTLDPLITAISAFDLPPDRLPVPNRPASISLPQVVLAGAEHG